MFKPEVGAELVAVLSNVVAVILLNSLVGTNFKAEFYQTLINELSASFSSTAPLFQDEKVPSVILALEMSGKASCETLGTTLILGRLLHTLFHRRRNWITHRA